MGKSNQVDMRRVIRAAVDAALEDPVPKPRRKRRLSTGRVVLVGAGLITVGRLAANSRGREMFGALRDRVQDVEDRFRGSDDDSPEDEGEFDEQEELDAEEEEPQAEAADDEFDEGEEPGEWDDEELDEDEPEPELDEDEPEPEPELEEDEQPRRKAPTRRGRGRK